MASDAKVIVNFQIYQKDRDRIAAKAEKDGVSFSQYIRAAIGARAFELGGKRPGAGGKPKQTNG